MFRNKTHCTQKGTLPFLLSRISTCPTLESTLNNPDWQLLFTYLNFDYGVRGMLHTTNWIERLHKSFKRTTKIRNDLPNPKTA